MTDLKDRILECACDLYLDEGYAGFSMRKLARALDVTAPALYRHFDSREDLLIEVILEGYRTQVHYLYRALSGADPAERLRVAGQGYLEFALDHPRYYGMLYAWADFMGVEDLPEAMADQIASVRQFWHDRVLECLDAGVLRAGTPEEISHTLWSQAHGVISLYLRGVTPMPEAEFRDLYMRSFLRIFAGLSAQPHLPEIVAHLEEVERHLDSTPLSAPL